MTKTKLSELNDEFKEKHRPLIEAFETEATYNNTLKLLNKVLETAVGHFSLKIKPKIEALLTISSDIYENLDNAIFILNKQYNGASLNPKEQKLAVFGRLDRAKLLENFYEAFLEYTIIHKEIVEAQKKLPHMFTELDKALKATEYHGGDFNSIIMAPIQRGPKYALLVDSLANKLEFKQDENGNKVPRKLNKLESNRLEYLRSLSENLKKATASANEQIPENNYYFGKLTLKLLGLEPSQKTPCEEDTFVLVEPEDDNEEEKEEEIQSVATHGSAGSAGRQPDLYTISLQNDNKVDSAPGSWLSWSFWRGRPEEDSAKATKTNHTTASFS